MQRFLELYFGGLLRSGVSGVLATLGIAIGVANIIALISVTDTARHQALGMMREVGADTLFVMPYIESNRGVMPRANMQAFLPADYAGIIAGLPEIDRTAAVLMMPGHVGYGAERRFVTIEGAMPDYPDVRGHVPERGRFHTAEEEARRARVCCLGSEIARQLFGDADPLGEQVVVKGQHFTVIGIMIEKGMIGFETLDTRVFIPLSTTQELYEIEGTHSVLARSTQAAGIKAARDAVDRALRAAGGLGPEDPTEYTINTAEELTGLLDETLGVFRLLFYGVASVALLVAGIGIMNVMLMQVIERTREIGVRRAVGARRRDILLQFLAEAAGQSVLGAALGIILGVGASLAYCALVKWEPYITWQTITISVLFSLAVSAAFAAYPAIRAAAMKPIDCLRYE